MDITMGGRTIELDVEGTCESPDSSIKKTSNE